MLSRKTAFFTRNVRFKTSNVAIIMNNKYIISKKINFILNNITLA